MHWIWQNIRDHLLYGRNKHFFLLSVFLLAGCGETTYWSKFDSSPDEFDPAFPKYRRYSVRREGDSAIRIMKL